MPLSPGTRVGPYEITGQLGAGGMGEVCRARDTKLGRDVALKVLPEAFATDADRMSRFQREAQLLAALNHPNIAAIYGLEDGPSTGSGQAGVRAIVMELVEGSTLTGPLPIDDALRIARQIAEAIEYAHDRGIIHRDLKPANIKVTPDGTVKVLDFGLAKAMDDSDSIASMTGTMSPTLSLGATYAGVIMGTAAYMAPEQAKGRPADRRSDIWSFGIVLCEMLTGDRMFGGDSVPETLASVMKDQITFGKLPETTPRSIRKLVARCLERDPRRRLQSIGEARIVIEDEIAGVIPEEARPLPAPPRPPVSRWLWIAVSVAVLLSAAAIGWIFLRPSPPSPLTQRFNIPPPEGGLFTNYRSFASNLAVSPDGRFVTFVVDEPGRERSLWVRALDSLTGQRLDRTGDAVYPFWSPDSRNIGYFAKNKLMRISVAGGAPQTIADAFDGEGGAWFQTQGQEIIVFADSQTGPLKRVLAQGGVITTVTKLADGESGHVFPQFLPDGRFLYLTRGTKPAIYVQSLDSGDRTLVLNSIGRVMFSPPGFLLYLRENTLLAHRWNLSTLKLEGEPFAIAEDVRSGGTIGRNAFAISSNGLLAYRAGGTGGTAQITWYSRDGKAGGVAVERGENGPFALAPDDQHLVLIRGTGDDRDLWTVDLATGVLSPLTTTRGAERAPVWSPDSRTVAYFHDEGGQTLLYETTIGSGKQTAISTQGKPLDLFDWTKDGRFLLTGAGGGHGNAALIAAPRSRASEADSAKPQVVYDEPYVASQFQVSPNSKWVAYTSQQSGQAEVWVAAFPSFTDRRQISSGGGVQPLWRGDGQELFFLARDQKLRAVEVKAGPTLETGPLQTLFLVSIPQATNNARFFAVSRDGKRFAVREAVAGAATAVEQLNVVTNWTSLVRR